MKKNNRSLLIIALAFIIASCGNNGTADKHNNTKTSPTASQDNMQTKTTTPDPRREIKKCFSNEGLKYNTTITIFTEGNEVRGNISSVETGSGTEQKAKFTGTREGNTLTVTIRGNAPLVGDASEWTNKPWTIETKDGKEKLLIPFNAKNYDTNKWQEMIYEFLQCRE